LKRIGITQRVEVVAAHNERRDCLDQAWTRLFSRLGLDFVLVPNTLDDVAKWARRQSLDALVLSGGNDLAHLPDATKTAPERDVCERVLLSWAASIQLPVLGVCRGMQMINCYLGGSLSPVVGHVGHLHPVSSLKDSDLFKGYDMVNSYHDWGINLAGLAAGLKAIVLAEDNTIEAFRHESLPWFGVMWHPERYNSLAMEQDFVMLSRLFNSTLKDFF
jgi:gamma-glutamyl-gamma-aminobutyrate hydrolase PuuD